MKRKIQRITAFFLMAALLVCPAFAASFPDVDDTAEYAEAVELINELGIMTGDEKGNFNPDKTVTRAEMAAIVCRMLGETEGLTTSEEFTDVPTGHWANAYISKAAELGIVNGDGNGHFMPSDSVTYEQAVTMVVRAAGWDENVDALGGYPEGYLFIAEGYQLISGITTKKGETLTRAHIAIMLFNYYYPPFLSN